jgi:hypothetical protein
VSRAPVPSGALAKLAKAARLSAEAAKLYAEASEELEKGSTPTPQRVDKVPLLSEVDVARARRALKRVGARIA